MNLDSARAAAVALVMTTSLLGAGRLGAANVDDAVVGQDLAPARIPGKVAAVHWTLRPDHCTLQVVFPNASRVARGSRTPDVQVWLLKGDGSIILPTRRIDPAAKDKTLRQPLGDEILFDYPRSADGEAVAVALRVDGAFHIEPLATRR